VKSSNARFLARLRDHGAILDGHFLLMSGKHSPLFIQCSQILQYPEEAESIGWSLAGLFIGEEPLLPSVVIGPALGGIILAHIVASFLGPARSAFTEKDPATGAMVFRRGFRLTEEDRVLLVEDVLTTGGSVLRSVAAVRATGASVVGVGLLVDRTDGRAAEYLGLGPEVPVRALASLEAIAYPPTHCPLCLAGVVELARPKNN